MSPDPHPPEAEERGTDDAAAPAGIPPTIPPVGDARETYRVWGERIFLQPEGVRAGWRAALYVALFVLLLALFSFVGAFVLRAGRASAAGRHSGAFTSGALFLQEVAMALSAIIATLVMGALERRRFGEYGMPLREALGARFWQGALWGLAHVTVLMLLIRACGDFSFGTLAIHGPELARYAVFWAGFFLIVGIAEEFLFRGYLQFTLASAMGFWPAAVVLSAGFGAVHLANPGEGPIGALSVFAIGMFFCFTLRRTGNLWFAIGMHAAFDFGETYIYSVPDSGIVLPGHLLSASLHGPRWITGGSIGPEGSVLAFAVLGVGFVIFDRLYRQPASTASP